MYEVGVVTQFEASHALRGDFGPATRMHGHTYRLEAIVQGDTLQASGVLFDITLLQAELDRLTADLHYRDLNTVAGLEHVNTTAEAMAHFCWERLAAALHGHGLTQLTVRVWENPQAWAARHDALRP